MIADAPVRAHARFVLTPWSVQGAQPPEIVRGDGARMYDADGKHYIDLSSGLVAANLGHAHPVMVEAIARARLRGSATCRPRSRTTSGPRTPANSRS
jgi:4-aminobutyrate aminotransferase-like enzyme